MSPQRPCIYTHNSSLGDDPSNLIQLGLLHVSLIISRPGQNRA